MDGIRGSLKRWMKPRYTRLLETEVQRLRVENRALLNSILGIAGIPPITVATAQDQKTSGSAEFGSGLDGAGVARLKTAAGKRNAFSGAAPALAAPVRRRSWHQINQTLELNAARKKESADGPDLGVAVKTQ